MAINLKKGEKVSLKKEAPNLKRLLIGLGWDPVDNGGRGIFKREAEMDIDASVICMDAQGRKEYVVYYGAQEHPSGAIEHGGDNLTGAGEGDDETIEIRLDRMPADVTKLSVIINIYQAYSRNQHLGKVRNCFVRAVDLDTGKELVRYDVNGQYNGMTGIFVADVYLYKGEWKFQAIGEGVKVKDIAEMVAMKCNR